MKSFLESNAFGLRVGVCALFQSFVPVLVPSDVGFLVNLHLYSVVAGCDCGQVPLELHDLAAFVEPPDL